MIRRRDPALVIILSFFTCSIYTLFWVFGTTNEINNFNEDRRSLSGGMVILLTILTCGLFIFYWYYMMGKNIYAAQQKAGIEAVDKSSLWLMLGLLSFFCCGLINLVVYFMIQSEMNRIIDESILNSTRATIINE